MPTQQSTIAHQQASLLTATNHREPWMPHEVELLDEQGSAYEQAAVLDRTYYAVLNARALLRKGVALGGGHGTTKRPEVKVCGCHGLQVLPAGGCPLD